MKNKSLVIAELILLVIAIVFAFLWIKYPEKNYEPFTVVPGLFSGIIEVYRRILNKEKKISRITVEEIVDSINNSPPFMREEMSRKYNGILVKWTGYLRSAEIDGNKKVKINLKVDKDSIFGNSIWFTEKIKNIPEIKALPEESEISVLGKIISASGPGISVTIKPIDVEII